MSFIKLFYQILKKHKYNFIVPLAITIFFAALNMQVSTTSEHKADIYFVDNDNTELTQRFKENIEKNANILDVSKTNDIEDDIITTFADCYIEIPSGFTEKFLAKEDAKIKLDYISNSEDGTLISNKVDTMLNNYRLYLENCSDNTEFYKYLASDDSIISIEENKQEDSKNSSAVHGYYFAGYGVISGIASIIGTFFMLIRKEELKNRYVVSPISNKKYLGQVILSTLSVDIIFVVLLTLALFVGIMQVPIDIRLLLNVLNCFVLSLLSIIIGLLLGFVIKSEQALAGWGTGISLALAFLGGLFVPLEIFSSSMVKIAQCTPCYWFAKICDLATLSKDINYTEIFKCLGIEFLFAFALLCVLGVVNRKMKYKNS